MSKKQKSKLQVLYKNPVDLKANPMNSRTHTEKQIHKIAKSIDKLNFNNPVLIDSTGMIVAGHGRVEAAKLLGMESIPTICLEDLTKDQIRAYIIADNKIADESGWDKEILKIELEYLINLDLDFDATVTGFEIPEIDLVINQEAVEEKDKEKIDPVDELPDENDVEKRVQSGDLWQLGNHKFFCGNALDPESFKILMGEERAGIAFVDNPYNVKIKGHVSKRKDAREFSQASGEMKPDEFTEFLATAFKNLADYSTDGSIHYHCMDWRHMSEILAAGNTVYSSLINLCVWDKITAGLGSCYRSQHELIFVFKNGTAPHINNVELGVHGRYRTNIWKYRGMHASNPEAKKLLDFHPTVKPVAMIMDALLDCSSQNDIVLDCFAGSGSTLLAAARTKRRARVIEIDEHYGDVILYRWEKLTGKKAKLIGNFSEKTQT